MTKTIKLDVVRIDGGTQMRVSIDTAHVDDLAEAIERGDDVPPPRIFDDGAAIWLSRGFHRYHAYRKLGRVDFTAEVVKGTVRDAILDAAGDNAEHTALKRSNADKRKAVSALLADKEWAGRSDRWIAEKAKVSAHIVSEMRIQVRICAPDRKDSGGVQVQECAPDRAGKDGKKYPAKPKPAEPDEDIDLDFTSPSKSTKPEPVTDAEGQKIVGEKLLSIFRRVGEIDELLRSVSSIKSTVIKAIEAGDTLFYPINKAEFQAECGNLFRALKFAKPHAVCPYCRGKGCKVCKNNGWVGKVVYENYTPEDLKPEKVA